MQTKSFNCEIGKGVAAEFGGDGIGAADHDGNPTLKILGIDGEVAMKVLTFLEELLAEDSEEEAPKPKKQRRKRRTKAEMEAAAKTVAVAVETTVENTLSKAKNGPLPTPDELKASKKKGDSNGGNGSDHGGNTDSSNSNGGTVRSSKSKSGDLGDAPESLAKAVKLKDVLLYLSEERGITDHKKLVAACEQWKEAIPVLSRIDNMEHRIMGAAMTLGIGQVEDN